MDWNGDGQLDILSGCYWSSGAQAGHIYLLVGRGGLEFATAEALQDREGHPLANLPITNPDDERITQNICTHQHAVDYDGDGDLDLVIGCFQNVFFLHDNLGGAAAAEFSGAAQQLPMKFPSVHSAPHLVDWDADGDLDLLSGTGHGGAIIAHNLGTRTDPKWSKFEQLIPPARGAEQMVTGDDQVKPSSNTRVWATDWNRDGMLDLLVGDCVTILRPAKGISSKEFHRRIQEFERQYAELEREQQRVLERFKAAIEEARRKREAFDEEIQNQLTHLAARQEALRESRSKYAVSRTTGYVWLYLRLNGDQVARR